MRQFVSDRPSHSHPLQRAVMTAMGLASGTHQWSGHPGEPSPVGTRQTINPRNQPQTIKPQNSELQTVTPEISSFTASPLPALRGRRVLRFECIAYCAPRVFLSALRTRTTVSFVLRTCFPLRTTDSSTSQSHFLRFACPLPFPALRDPHFRALRELTSCASQAHFLRFANTASAGKAQRMCGAL